MSDYLNGPSRDLISFMHVSVCVGTCYHVLRGILFVARGIREAMLISDIPWALTMCHSLD